LNVGKPNFNATPPHTPAILDQGTHGQGAQERLIKRLS
jgi:hypothetical protein